MCIIRPVGGDSSEPVKMRMVAAEIHGGDARGGCAA